MTSPAAAGGAHGDALDAARHPAHFGVERAAELGDDMVEGAVEELRRLLPQLGHVVPERRPDGLVVEVDGQAAANVDHAHLTPPDRLVNQQRQLHRPART